MSDNDRIDARSDLVDLLLEKISQDLYPSNTTMDIVEQLLLPDEVPAYAEVLMDKIRGEAYPSVSMLRRLLDLTQPA